ncbi:ASKHA domain-containing protein [Candidatus Bipolaricaulota bacterium]
MPDRSSDENGVRLTLLPSGRVAHAPRGATYLDALRVNGIDLAASCGGARTCGECRIRFASSSPEPTEGDRMQLTADQIEDGWRLACAHRIEEPAAVFALPVEGDLDAKRRSDEPIRATEVDSGIRMRTVEVPVASRDDSRSDLDRFRDALGSTREIPIELVRRLRVASEAPPTRITIIEDDRAVIDFLDEDRIDAVFGLAIDVGTSTLAVYLFDLATGDQMGVAAGSNPQSGFGADVITRIARVRAEGREALDALRGSVLGGLDRLIGDVCSDAGISEASIYRVVAVGNPTMMHLLLGVDPTGIDVAPFIPAFSDGLRLRADEIGLAVNGRAVVDVLPAVSAYVGADIVAGVLHSRIGEQVANELLIDLGTNGEIVLAASGRLSACSAAAGPAFEGASIVDGMSALPGAIESVVVRDETVECDIRGDVKPIGICGSGLVAAIAELRRADLIDAGGRLKRTGSPVASRIEGDGAGTRFRLTDGESPIYLYQQDVRAFQLAKAAIRTGIEALLGRAGMPAGRLDRILVGGAFGSRLKPDDLIGLGVVPPVDPPIVQSVGNCAGQGAKAALLSKARRIEAQRIADRVEYIELSGSEGFGRAYVRNLHFRDP